MSRKTPKSTNEIKDNEIIIPIRPKSPPHGKKSNLSSTLTKSLFNPTVFDQTNHVFDVVSPAVESNDDILRNQSPGLLALRKQTAKSIPKHSRPTTAVSSLANTTNIPSLICKQPLSRLRDPSHIDKGTYEKEKMIELDSINFHEDPVAYFSKRKDGRGHRFIYLVHSMDRDDFEFSPYNLKKVSSLEIGNNYFTMSANGVTHMMPDGNTESIPLDRWSKESSIFKSIRKLRTFSLFFFWKPFRIWRNFVMRQRYDQLTDTIMTHSFFNNYAFYQTALVILQESSDDLLRKLLLSFHSQKKYSLDDFVRICRMNNEKLKEEYNLFIESIVNEIIQLDTDIRDPDRIIVEDSDFPEIKRRNPNLGQLMVLERKKDTEKKRRGEIVIKEIHAFGHFVRLIDYVLLESLSSCCFECWKEADLNVSTDMSSVFEIEISFSEDGKILFSPKLDELVSAISYSLDESLSTLNSLPRVLRISVIRNHIRESIPDLNEILSEGPSFKNFINCNYKIQQIKDHILEVIKSSYHEAYEASQQFIEFFQIYQTGQTWNPQSYIHERGGSNSVIDLSVGRLKGDKDEIKMSYDPSSEKIIDFSRISSDIERFRNDEIKIQQFRSCTLRGALYVDSKQLRNTLAPIPVRAVHDIQVLLQNLMVQKIDFFQTLFRYCSKYLKREPASLEQFVDFCDFVDRASSIIPFIVQEITFVDDLLGLFESFGFILSHDIDQSRNPLHIGFSSFKSDLITAQNIKELHSDKFMYVLQQKIRQKERKLLKYHDIVTTYPASIDKVDITISVDIANTMKTKVQSLDEDVKDLIHSQKILGVSFNDFSLFQTVLDASSFLVDIYQAVGSWNQIQELITKTPLSSVNIPKFRASLVSLDGEVRDLTEKSHPSNPLLYELEKSVSNLVPNIEPLERLSSGRMQTHHWNKLFEECGQPTAYHQGITIVELNALGILSETEKIIEITSKSQGESQLEAEFKAIQLYWQEVKIPLLESEKCTREEPMIGNLQSLFHDIAETQINLQKMLSIPFVQGIKDSIITLSTKLESISKILEEWQVFQLNWPILSKLFLIEDIKSVLSKQADQFLKILNQWPSFITKALASTNLFIVCEQRSLIEVLRQNNKFFESVLSSLMKYFDTKRYLCPRLFFLSNDEILRILTSFDFSSFSSETIKLFMHVQSFDTKKQESDDINPHSKGFSQFTISGLKGEDGDSLPLSSIVHCSLPLDQWVSQMINSMKTSVRDNFSSSIARFQSSNMKEWISTVSTYIALLTLNVSFTREIQECFNSLETNSRAFSSYESLLQTKMHEISTIMSSPLSTLELSKLSTICTSFSLFISQVKSISEKFSNYSPKMNWNLNLRYRFHQPTSSVYIDYGESSTEHGYEFWGNIKPFIHFPSSEKALKNLCSNLISGKVPLLFGPENIGKKHLLMSIASLFGRYIFLIPTFCDFSEMQISRFVTGAAMSGSWISFNNAEMLSHQVLSYLYDTIKSVSTLQNVGGSRISISNKVIELQKSCRIIVTSQTSFMNEKSVPPELKFFLKPIGMASPDPIHISLTKLTSYGFRYSKSISSKLFHTLSVLLRAFSYIQSQSVLSYIFSILDQSYDSLRQLMHSKGASFVNYYENPKVTEEYVVVRSIYLRLFSQIHKEDIDVFMELLFSNFRIFDNYDTFKSTLIHPGCFIIEDAASQIITTVKDIIRQEKINIPIDYLLSQIVSLYQIMQNFPFIIIYGGPNSGKSIIVDLLKKAFLILSQDAELINRFFGISPMRIIDVFHNSTEYKSMFGSFFDDNATGTTQRYGHFFTYLTDLNRDQKTHHRILRFNGPMTCCFSSFIQEFITSVTTSRGRINTNDSIVFDSSFHIIIETDRLVPISPSAISKCGFLPMINQYLSTHVLSPKTISFEQLLQTHSDIVFSVSYSELNSMFNVISSEFIQYFTQNAEHHNKLLGNNIEFYINDHLIRSVIPLFVGYIEISSIGYSSISYLMKIAVHSFFLTFCVCFEEDFRQIYHNWCVEKFELSLPHDWSGFDVPNEFLEEYPIPSLFSVKFFRGNFIPHDYSQILSLPVGLINSQLPQLIEDTSVCTNQFLTVIFQMSILLRRRQHILLFGEPKSGKTSLLRMLFRQLSGFTPVFIPLNSNSSIKSISYFIKTHSVASMKPYIMQKNSSIFLLIFENVDPNQLHIIESIRLMLTNGNLVFASKNDPKIYDEIPLNNFVIIVTSSSFGSFSPRFSKFFVPILLPKPNSNSVYYIINHLMSFFEVPSSLSTKICRIIDFILKRIPLMNPYRIVRPLPFSSFKSFKSKDDIMKILNLLIFQFDLETHHRNDVNEFQKVIHSFINETFDQDNDSPMKFLITNYSFSISEDGKKGVLIENTKDKDDMMFDIQSSINTMNQELKEKIIIKWNESTTIDYLRISYLLSYPFGNCTLVSNNSYLKRSLARYYSVLNNYEFIDLSIISNKRASRSQERKVLNQKMNEIILNAILLKKKALLFYQSPSFPSISFDLLNEFMKTCDYTIFYTGTDILQLYQKFSTSLSQPEDVLMTHRSIKDLIKLRIRLLIGVEHLKPGYTFSPVVVSPNQTLLNSGILATNLPHELLSSYPKIISILMDTHSKAQNYGNFVTHNNLITLTQFIYNNYNQDIQKYCNKSVNSKSSIKFFNLLIQHKKSLEDKISEIRPKLIESREKSDGIRNGIESRKKSITDRIVLINEEENSRKIECIRVEDNISSLNQMLSDATISEASTRSLVHRMDANDKHVLALSSENPPVKLKLFSRVLCALIGLDPNFETEGKKLLSDKGMIPLLLEKIRANSIEMDLSYQIRALFSSSNFTQSEMDSISPQLGILFSWINSIYHMVSVSIELSENHKELEVRKENLDKYRKEVAKEKNDLEMSLKQVEEEFNKLNESFDSERIAETEMKSLENRINRIIDSIKDIDILIPRWEQLIQKESNQKEYAIFDLVISAFYLAYISHLPSDLLSQSLEFLATSLNRIGFSSSSSDYSMLCKNYFAIKYGKNNNEDQFPSLFSIEHYSHLALASSKVPYIIDSSFVIRQYLESYYSPKNIVLISLMSNKFETALIDAVKEGYILFVTDFDQYNSSIECILSYPYDYDDEIKIGSSSIKKNPSFKLFLFTDVKPTNNDHILHLLENTTLIDGSHLSTQSCEQLITHHVLTFISQDFSSKQKHLLLDYNRSEGIVSRTEDDLFNEIHRVSENNSFDDLDKIIELKLAILSAFEERNHCENDQNTNIESISPIIHFCCSIWEILSNYMPRINWMHQFSLTNFVGLISTTLNGMGIKQPSISPELFSSIQNSIIHSLSKSYFCSMSTNEIMVFLFLLSIKSYEKEHNLPSNNLNAIIQHIYKVYDSYFDVHSSDSISGEPINQLKVTNISSVFPYIHRLISNLCGLTYTNLLPFFAIESFITTSSSVPVFIHYDFNNCPVSLLEHFVSIRNRLDSFDSYSMTDNIGSLEDIYKTVTSAMSRGGWILLNYSFPTPLNSQYITDVCTLVLNGTPSPNFRLIIMTHDFSLLPSSILSRCTRFSYSNFPSIRHQMLQLFQHYSSSMRSSTNPRAIKKFTYSVSLLYSIINYRSIMNPIGFSQYYQIPETVIRDLIELIRLLIDSSNNSGIPTRNLRDIIQDSLFGSHIIDTFDRRKMRTHIYSLVTPEILDDSYRFIDIPSEENDQWTVPVDAPITNYSNMISKIPVFANCDVMNVPHMISTPIRNYVLSRWISKPLICLGASLGILNENHVCRWSKLMKAIPESLNFENQTESPFGNFIKSEIAFFNSGRKMILIDIHTKLSENPEYCSDIVPDEWKEALKYKGSRLTESFVEYMNKKKAFLSEWSRVGLSKKFVDIRYISNLKGFFYSYLNEIAFQKQVSTDTLILEYSFSSEHVSYNDFIVITGAYILSGSFDQQTNKLCFPNSKTLPFTEIPALICYVSKKNNKKDTMYLCPMFRSLPSQEYCLESDLIRKDGEIENFIRYIPIKSDVSDKHLISAGTSIICQMPDSFTHPLS